MCLVYSIHKASKLRNCIHEVTFHLNTCDHYCWHQTYNFAIPDTSTTALRSLSRRDLEALETMSTQARNEKENARTYLVQDENRLLFLVFPSPDFDGSIPAAPQITCVRLVDQRSKHRERRQRWLGCHRRVRVRACGWLHDIQKSASDIGRRDGMHLLDVFFVFLHFGF